MAGYSVSGQVATIGHYEDLIGGMMVLYASGEVDHRGVNVVYVVDNDSPFPTWEYQANGRYASVAVEQDRDDDDNTGPVTEALYLEDERQQGQWAWDICHQKALDYVAFGTFQAWSN